MRIHRPILAGDPSARRTSTARPPPLYADRMAAPSTPESTPQRLAAIRAQMSLLADYL